MRLSSIALGVLPLLSVHARSEAVKELPHYRIGDSIPISCLKRNVDTGEHIVDETTHQLIYEPFPTCAETGRPMELTFGVEQEKNCTIDFVDDPTFHLLEFYIHNDAPMTCRIPARPLSANTPSLKDAQFSEEHQVGALGTQSTAYIPLVVALSGTLQLSHVHVANHLNVLLHAAPKKEGLGLIDAATAYSVNTATRTSKVKIGDSLSLKLSVRWYPDYRLPSGWTGMGGHLTGVTLIYCMLSAGATAAILLAYFRGFELPRRLQRHGRDRLGLGRESSRFGGGYGGPSLPTTNGGLGGGWGYAGTGGGGKVD